MAGPQRIDSHFLHQLQLAECGLLMERGTQRAEIMMQAYPLEFDMFIIDKETGIRIHPDRPEAEFTDSGLFSVPVAKCVQIRRRNGPFVCARQADRCTDG